MLTFKILSVLLSYPEMELLPALTEMSTLIKQEQLLPEKTENAVLSLIDALRTQDVFDSQEYYVTLFDRGRFLSLHIFEHVHGESRERGQAMVNLLDMYESHGFQVNVQELPDYIPLFLEFLSQIPQPEAQQLLQDALPVLALLGARLIERNSGYAAIFDALLDLAGAPELLAESCEQIALEGEDDTLVNLDAIWEEEMVSFMGTGATACQTESATTSPITIMSRDQLRSQQEQFRSTHTALN